MADQNKADDQQFYRVEEVIRSKSDCACPACVMWTVVCDEDGEPTEICTSWQGEEGKETAEDICDLMNMAFARGIEEAPSRG